MNLDSIIFVDNLPTIDLHGLDKQTCIVTVNDFIIDNIKCKNEFIVIIHGFGEYILRNTTHEILKKHKNVKDFKLFIYNTGCTIVQLKLN